MSASESNGKMQEELAALFDRQMTIDQRPSTQTASPSLSYSISRHYHHSSHVVLPPNPTPPQIPANTTSSIPDMLRQHGLNPNALSSSQLHLIEHADAEQQQRLIQTWQFYTRSTDGALAGVTQGPESFSIAEDHEMDDPKEQAEPYMVSGYQANTRPTQPTTGPTTGQPYASATDPVYKTQQWWEVAPMGPISTAWGN